MTTQNQNPDNPDLLGTDPIIPGMKPDPLPEDPDVVPVDEVPPQDEEDPEADGKKINIGPIDLA